MTNDTTPTPENGQADAGALLAAMTETTESTSENIVAAEPKAPSFDDLGLHPDVKQALDDMGYFAPTPVQTAVFKPVSEGKNLLVQSRTGTGKTTAFGLPLVNKLIPTHRQPQALILAPTRELALQVSRELTNIGKHRGIVIEALYGGAPIGKQITNLRNGVHIVVGTPGRVLDHIGRRTLDCKTISTFVLDECDEMLSMGFLEDIEKITSFLPDKHQTMLFSATMPDEVQRYARRHMPEKEQISLSRDSVSVSDIHHAYYIVSGIARSRDLLKILFAEEPESAIIFCNTRDETTMVAKFLTKQGLDAEPLSSDLSQNDRERVMGRMKAKNLRFLCATDVAARGIDISNLSHVINYSVPESPEVYVHRTGRTGRAGKKGTALSLVGPRELGNFRFVRLTFGIKPEERLLPKDDIFIGKLKVPLPPVGVPQPPDPVQILIRGVTGTPTDLEKSIMEKLLAKNEGRRVLAALVADKLNALSTKTSRPRRVEHTDAPPAEGGAGGGERPRFDRDRPRFGEGGGDRDRPRFGEGGGDRGDRPRFDRDRGDRPRFGADGDRGGPGAGPDRGDRGDRPRFGADGDRPRFDRDRGDRPRFDRDRGPRPEGAGAEGAASAAPAGAEGGERSDRGDRPRFDRDRGDRPRFDRDRDRGPRAEGAPGAEGAATAAPGAEGAERSDRGDRPRFGGDDRGGRFGGDRDRGDRGGRFGGDRDRGDRGGRFGGDRDRGRNRDEARTDSAPAAAADASVIEPTAVGTADVAAAPEVTGGEGRERFSRDDRPRRDDRGDRGGRFDRDRGGRDRDRGGRDAEVSVQDSTAPVAAVTETPDATVEASTERSERSDRGDRGGRDRDRGGRGRDRDRGGRDRDRSERRPEASASEAAPEAAPAVASPEASTDAAAPVSADRGGKKKGRGAEPTESTREFWETWAENKTTREPEPAAAAPAKAASDDEGEETETRGARSSRGGRSRGGRDRGGRSADKDKKSDDGEKRTSKAAPKDEGTATRTKRDTTVNPPAAAANGDQARLFISLGKKHGVSAEDLRTLLAGPIGGDTSRIGSVSLRDSHAHVRVPEDAVDAIISGVHGTLHNEHNVTVERARA